MNKENVKKSGVRLATVFSVIVICLFLYTTVFMNVKIKEIVVVNDAGEEVKTWHVLWEGSLAEAAEATPASGASGFLEIFFLNHTANPAVTYTQNTSSNFETWANANLAAAGSNAYANADNFNLQLKYGVAMDIVVRARWNKTHAWNGTAFIGSDCRINITTTGGGIVISGTVSGTNVISRNVSTNTYIWINVYWNNAHAGYILSKGGTCTISSISIQAKY